MPTTSKVILFNVKVIARKTLFDPTLIKLDGCCVAKFDQLNENILLLNAIRITAAVQTHSRPLLIELENNYLFDLYMRL